MKKSFLLFGLIATTLVSCETKEEAKDDKDNTVKTVEISKDSYLDFNDAIIVEIGKAQDILNVLKDKDAQDISEEEMKLASNDAKEKAKELKTNLNSIAPAGKGSEEYLAAAIALVESTINLTEVYNDFAASLSVTEMQWNEAQVTDWQNMAEPAFMEYLDAFKHLGIMQQNYAAFQDLKIEPLVEEEKDTIDEPITI